MSKVARSADLRMFEGARYPGDICYAPTGVERRCESFEETEQSGSHMVSKGTFDTYLIGCIISKKQLFTREHESVSAFFIFILLTTDVIVL